MHERNIFLPELPDGQSRIYDDTDINNTTRKAHHGYIFVQVRKAMYGIPQSGQLEHYSLVKHLETYGYPPSRKTGTMDTRQSSNKFHLGSQ